MSNLLRRTLTAVWIVIFILGGFWLHPVSFFITGLVLMAGTQYEYYSIIKGTGITPRTIPGLIAGASVYTLSALVSSGTVDSKWFLLILPLLSVIMTIELFRKEGSPFDNLAHTFFPLLYSVIPFSLFPFAAFSGSPMHFLLPSGTPLASPGIIVGFFLILWANDTGAYLTGVTIGRHRLMERISPKKSWEGFFGGLVIAALAAWLLSGWLGIFGPGGWIIISVIISITGTFGDLVESMLKRSTGIKDSGSIMPGHGGFLDRFDSTLISFPFVYLFISLFG